jgi:IS30 family transposase
MQFPDWDCIDFDKVVPPECGGVRFTDSHRFTKGGTTMNQRLFYHLTRTDRDLIAEGIASGTLLKDIAATLGFDATAISREVKRNRSYEGLHLPHTNRRCVHWEQCDYHNLCSKRCTKKRCALCATHACMSYCMQFEQRKCIRLERWPYVCNGCEPAKQRRCELVRFKYYPSIADAKAIRQRSEPRQGISVSADQLVEIDRHITPLIKVNKMSVEAALKACAEEGIVIPVSAPTIRRYIERGDSGVIRLDLLSAPSRKVRKKQVRRATHHLDDGRSFADFKKLSAAQKEQTWEIDTVIGSKRDRCRLLTLCHRHTNFLLIFKIERSTCECVVGVLDWIEDITTEAGFAFSEVFALLLTDNGPEFSGAASIEASAVYPGPRCALFYCDPYSSWQKPHVENAHTLIRRVLPKGVSFESLTRGQVVLLCNHINSYPRSSHADTPYRRISGSIPIEALIGLGIKDMPPKKVMLNPTLMDSTK